MTSTSEEWRPVVGWEDSHEVSSLGRVRSLDRYVPWRYGQERLAKGRVLAMHPQNTGYLIVQLKYAPRPRKAVTVHALVLEAFVGPKPDGMEARHLDGDQTNNRPDNLRWGTRSENALDKVGHGTHNHASKTTCPQGHPYDLVDAKGWRKCSTCRRESMQRHYARKKALA